MYMMIPASKEPSTCITSLSLSTHSIVSDRHLSHCNVAEKILGEGFEHAQTVCTRLFFSTQAQKPGSKASCLEHYKDTHMVSVTQGLNT